MGEKLFLNCSHQPEELVPNGDIAGPGVLVGFLGTACLAVVSIVGYYLFAFDPVRNPFASSPGPEGTIHSYLWVPNPVDTAFLATFRRQSTRRLSPTMNARVQRLEEKFISCILNFCDIQITTGIAILISAYVILPRGLSAYHWQIAVYLAWFANLTHLSGLSCLRAHLQKDRQNLNLRILSMAVFLILLLYAKVPTAFFNWHGNEEPTAAVASSYAWCFFNVPKARKEFRETSGSKLENTAAYQNMIVSFLLLTSSFLIRLIKLYKWPSRLMNNKIRGTLSRNARKLIKQLENLPGTRSWGPSASVLWRRLVVSSSFALFLLVKAYIDMYTSMLFEVYWLLVSMTWGTLHLFLTKQSVTVNESEMTFGQILPIVLLVAPLLPVARAIIPLLLHPFELWPMAFLAVSHPPENPDPGNQRDLSNVRTLEPQSLEDVPTWLLEVPLTSLILPTTVMAFHTTFLYTIIVFVLIAYGFDALKTFKACAFLIFLVYPLTCFCLIHFSIYIHHQESSENTSHIGNWRRRFLKAFYCDKIPNFNFFMFHILIGTYMIIPLSSGVMASSVENFSNARVLLPVFSFALAALPLLFFGISIILDTANIAGFLNRKTVPTII